MSRNVILGAVAMLFAMVASQDAWAQRATTRPGADRLVTAASATMPIPGFEVEFEGRVYWAYYDGTDQVQRTHINFDNGGVAHFAGYAPPHPGQYQIDVRAQALNYPATVTIDLNGVTSTCQVSVAPETVCRSATVRVDGAPITVRVSVTGRASLKALTISRLTPVFEALTPR